MPTYKEIQEKIATLQAQAESARATEIEVAVAQIRGIMEENGISLSDLQGKGRRNKGNSKSKNNDVQFRDGQNTWSGRGRKPAWMQGKDKEQYRVA